MISRNLWKMGLGRLGMKEIKTRIKVKSPETASLRPNNQSFRKTQKTHKTASQISKREEIKMTQTQIVKNN